MKRRVCWISPDSDREQGLVQAVLPAAVRGRSALEDSAAGAHRTVWRCVSTVPPHTNTAARSAVSFKQSSTEQTGGCAYRSRRPGPDPARPEHHKARKHDTSVRSPESRVSLCQAELHKLATRGHYRTPLHTQTVQYINTLKNPSTLVRGHFRLMFTCWCNQSVG